MTTIKVFVLIYTMMNHNHSVEFGSLGECERAAAVMEQHFVGWRFRYVCVEKTTIPVAR